MEIDMKPRNPVAGNAWKYNKPKVEVDKKKTYQRRALRKFDYELIYDE
jgi:hypothetical protein